MNDSLQAKIRALTPEQREMLHKLLPARGRVASVRRRGSTQCGLSLAQRRVWLLDQLDQNAHAYNIPSALRIRGTLNIAALEHALTRMAERHEVLRTRFERDETGEPLQIISPHAAAHFSMETAPAFVDIATREQWQAERLRELVRQRLDLASGKCWFAHLISFGKDDYTLLLNFHHIVADAWSFRIFARELFAFYEAALIAAEAALLPMEIQYADYVEWQNETFDAVKREREMAFWRDTLVSDMPTLALPTDRLRLDEQTFDGATLKRMISTTLFDNVREFARANGTTPYVVFLAAFDVLLFRITGQTDLVVGTPISGRNHAEIEPLLGMFVNTLPIRAQINPEQGFAAAVRAVREASLTAFEHQELPFDVIVEAVRPARIPGVNPIFQVLYTYQNAFPPVERAGLRVDYMEVDAGASKFDLSLDILEDPEHPAILLEYNTALFDAPRIERMASHFLRLLEAAIADSRRSVSLLPMLDADEEKRVLCHARTAKRPLPEDHFVRQFAQIVTLNADRIAVVDDTGRYTYADLDQTADRIAACLQSRGVVRGDIVGIALERSAASCAAIIGTLRAGAAFVALDPAYPAERLAYVAEDTSLVYIVTDSAHVSAVEHIDVRRFLLDQNLDDDALLKPFPVDYAAGDAAYVVYTSGTTGKPKGVVVEHRQWMNSYFGWEQIYHLNDIRAHLQMASFSFDVFCGDFIRALGSGSIIVICPQTTLGDPRLMLQLMREENIECAEFVPAVFRTVAEHLVAIGERLDFLKILVVASDAWYGEEYERYKRSVCGPHTRLVNSYGMAEAAIDSTYFEGECGEQAGQLVPIGKPFPNVDIVLVDANMQPVPIGVIGEICVGGWGVARGYLHRPELNNEKFVANPFSDEAGARLYRSGDYGWLNDAGEFLLVGRRDRQVKIRGLRIELAEIEVALRSAPSVSEAAVIVREDAPGDPRIVAYFVRDNKNGESVTELVEHVGKWVPSYMVPACFIELNVMPLSANGKVDRNALPAPDATSDSASSAFVSPRTFVEEMLATIWCQVLGYPRISVHDSFFSLGGHSLLALQIVARVKETFEVDVPLAVLFRAPTIAGLAAAISERQGKGDDYRATIDAVVTIIPDTEARHEPFPLTDVQQAYWLGRNNFFEFGGVTTHSYDELETDNLDPARFQRAWNKVIRRHEMLRAVLLPDGRQRILPKTPDYQIRVYDLVGKTPQEVAATLDSIRGELSHQALDLMRWPNFDLRVSLLDGGKARLHFSSDAVIFDVWSFIILIEELVRFYSDESLEISQPALSFRDYVLAESNFKATKRYKRALEYWRGRVTDLPAAPDLPLACDPATLKKPHFSRLHFSLTPDRWTSLKKKAMHAGLTASGIALAAYAEVLGFYSRDPAFSLNLTFLNRRPVHPQVNQIVGEFTSLTMLGIDQRAGERFVDRARKIQADLWSDLEHNDVSGIEVLRELTRVQGGATRAKMPVVFTSALVVPVPKPASEFPLRPIYDASITQTSQVWLDCGVWEDQGSFRCNWDVVRDVYPEGLIDEMFAAFEMLMTRLADDDAVWEERAFIGYEEQNWLSSPANGKNDEREGKHCNDGCRTWHSRLRERGIYDIAPLPLTDSTLVSLFLNQVARNPHNPAIFFSQGKMSYGALAEHAAFIAQHLLERGTAVGELVAVAMTKGWEQVAATLGVMATRAAYLPVDLTQPDERIARILAEGRVRTLLTQPDYVERFSQFDGISAIAVTEGHHAPVEVFKRISLPKQTDLAYVIFTSGSTGTPKGVMIDHCGVVNTILDINDRFGIGPDDRAIAISALNFDLSVYDLFGLLAAGGAIVMPAHDRRLDPTHWTELVRRHRVTLWNTVPALAGLLIDYLDSVEMPLDELRHVMLSGDWIPLSLPARIKARCAKAQATSLGGATEASIWSILYPIDSVPPDWVSIPYGRAMRNQSMHVLDHHLEERPTWVPGDIYIGGVGLSLGYYGDAVKTAAAFITHPRTGERLYRTGDMGRWRPDGNIEFLGRNDFQVKVQGHRIELGDVESALRSYPGLLDTVVIAIGDSRGEKRLGACVVGEGVFSGEELRAYLTGRLPEYMVPHSYLQLRSLPLSANGKVDRNRLAELLAPTEEETSPVDYVAPRDENERRIAAIWTEVLGIDTIDVSMDFFSAGGHSMLAIRLLTLLRQHTDYDFKLEDIFKRPTIAAQAALMQHAAIATHTGD